MKPYYEHGGITIYHGDCREVLADVWFGADLLLTDPPYGIGANRMTLGNGKRVVFRGNADWDAAAPDLAHIMALPIPKVIWGGNYFSLPPSRCWLVWDKGTGDNDFADCELAWTDRDAVVKKFFRSWVGANAKERHEPDRYHPTQKPVALMRWCLGLYPDARRVVDPYMGVGTTLIAAKESGRSCVGIEAEERYCEIAAKRLSQEVLPLEHSA